MINETYHTLDTAAIERRAHALRAEATAQAFRALRDWISHALHTGKSHTPT